MTLTEKQFNTSFGTLYILPVYRHNRFLIGYGNIKNIPQFTNNPNWRNNYIHYTENRAEIYFDNGWKCYVKMLNDQWVYYSRQFQVIPQQIIDEIVQVIMNEPEYLTQLEKWRKNYLKRQPNNINNLKKKLNEAEEAFNLLQNMTF